jgi:hypothetical protein
MPTSLAPSPIANVIASIDRLTSSTTSAFCFGLTLKLNNSGFFLLGILELINLSYRQQITVLHETAKSRKF